MSNKIYIIDRSSQSDPVAFGKRELIQCLDKAGAEIATKNFWPDILDDNLYMVIGETSQRLVEKLLEENDVKILQKSEGVIIHWCSTGAGKVLAVSGTDEKGLMYALLEISDRIRCHGLEELLKIEDIEEYPDNKVRGVDRFVMSQRDDEWFYSIEFWEYLFKRMAKNRFNRFTLILGFDTAYMAPPYPFFADVPGFPDVRLKDMTEEAKKKNLEMLQMISKRCKAYGIEFFFGTWQQMPWTKNQSFMVENIPEGEADFARYCGEGLRQILIDCPDIAGVQLRVNMEAGVHTNKVRNDGDTSNTAVDFWNVVVDSVAAAGRNIKLDIRAKGLTDSLLRHAQNTGLDISVPTKYWCEHAALPYHIPQMRTEEMVNLEDSNASRRYSYDNLLKKPHWYDMIFRLWNYGSTNLFLWGDPDYCRRFAESCGIGGAIGFEINTPLSLKGGHQFIPGESWPIHINPEIIDYNWEDERYWAYYLSFGRYGYNTKAGAEIWRREFDYRFGKSAEFLETAYRCASKVMPLITTVHFPVHPSLHYWPELYAGAALFGKNNYEPYFKDIDYITALPSDETFFYGIGQYADDLHSGELKEKYSPLQVRDWLKNIADNIRMSLGKVEEDASNIPEVKATIIDFKMLAAMAEFHAWKIKSAFHLCLFRQSGSKAELEACFNALIVARSFWLELSALGNKYYNHNLEFNAGTGTRRNGNWEDRLIKEIDLDVACIEEMLTDNGIEADEVKLDNEYKSMIKSLGYEINSFTTDIPEACESGRDLVVNVKIGELNKNDAWGKLTLNYRRLNQHEGVYNSTVMQKTAGGYRAVIPAGYITPGWDLIVFVSGLDSQGNAFIYPGIYNTECSAPYKIVEVNGYI